MIALFAPGWWRFAKNAGSSFRVVECAGARVRDRNAWLAIVGLAPGKHGANRTGRPFTGDFAGELLYATLLRFGLAQGKICCGPC